MDDDLKRVVVWRNLLLNGTDYCALWHTAEGWLVKGTVVGVLKDQRPMLANYEIYCDENWLTHRAQVERKIGTDVKSPNMSVQSRGVWRSSAKELRDLHGCADVDLASDARHQYAPNQASQPPNRKQRVGHRRLGQVSLSYGSTAFPTLHAARQE